MEKTTGAHQALRDKLETYALRLITRPEQESTFRARLIELADIRPDTSVIDIATAVGGVAFEARQKTEHVTAIDASPQRIEIAKADPRAGGIRFLVEDATNTPFDDNEFDVAFIVLGLHEMKIDGARGALKETRRIAKRLVIMEFGLDDWPLFWSFFRWALAIFEPPGFLKMTRYNLGDLIERAGWRITHHEKTFPFAIYTCEQR